MAITTRVAPMYGGQKIFAAILFAVFGLWGAYDYFIKIPAKEARANEYIALTETLREYEDRRLTSTEAQEVQAATSRMAELAPGGEAPIPPSKFDRITQWFFMACLPFAPWFLIVLAKAKRQKYTLDDDGTLHFSGDPELQSGAWSQEEIADIDMSRWMAKSIAYAVHRDGRRLKLDAFLYKDLHLIIGAIASRLYPDQWDIEAKKVKPPEDETAEGGEPQDIHAQAGDSDSKAVGQTTG